MGNMITKKRREELRGIIARGEDFLDGSTLYLSKQAKADILTILDENIAAPELLEALEGLIPMTWNDGSLCEVYREAGKKAEAAIAKAQRK